MRPLIHELLTYRYAPPMNQIPIPSRRGRNTSGKRARIASLANSQRAILDTNPTEVQPLNSRDITHTWSLDAGDHVELLVKVQFRGKRLSLGEGMIPTTRAGCVC